MKRFATPFLCVVLAGMVLVPTRGDGSDFFRKSVAPLLTARCSGCHNASDRKGGLDITTRDGLMTGGDSGPAVVLGQPKESLLWQRIHDGEMPPQDALSPDEQSIVARWIEEQAKWTGGPLDPFEFTTARRAGYDWWSLQPLPDRVAVPSIELDTDSNAVDAFLLEKLRAAQLEFSLPADRRTLVRRLYLDLTGLPPAPEDVEAFLADDSPTAYVKLVDQLLASPAYGERWARHWLDLARFGESQGFERDKLRTNSWRFRDWVIRAFNDDLPYDQFARYQLAGDALSESHSPGITATGFLVAGPYDEVGQKQQSAAMKAVVREDELEDIVGTVCQTFLGLTVNCARCHDHKFDPISQKEYYQLTAALAGAQHGEPHLAGDFASKTAVAATKQRIRTLEQKLEELESPVRERLLAQRIQRAKKASPPTPLARWDFDSDAHDSLGSLHGELREGAKVVDGKLILDGKGYVATAPIETPLRAKTLEAFVRLDNLAQQGGAAIAIQTPDGAKFDAIVYGEKTPRMWLAGSNYFERTQSFQGHEEEKANHEWIHVAIVYHDDGTIVCYRNGNRYGKEYKSSVAEFPTGGAQVLLGLRHSPPGGNRHLRGAIDRAALYDRALSDEEIAVSAGNITGSISEQELLAELTADHKQLREEIRFELDQLRADLIRLMDPKVYAVLSSVPGERYVLIRGNPAQPADAVKPAGIAALRGVSADFPETAENGDRARRLHLADWIANGNNPLFARVMVNRLWHYHFGVGIVDTPNDFGFNGGRPSHPELLDWLAVEFIRSGFSVKHVQRIIVTSTAYRQSSATRDEGLRADASNRLLWRKSPQRLEAEVLRDAMLSVAGVLNDTMFGPGFYDFRTFTHNSQFYELRDPTGYAFQRRSIYRTWVRSGRSPFLDVFDCPDPSTKTPVRAATTTPLQALSLLNNSFSIRTADSLAARIRDEVGEDVTVQVTRLFDLALTRPPIEEERLACEQFLQAHGSAALCRVIINSNEFVFSD